VYARLPGALAVHRATAADATVVLLDEYLGLPAGHPARCDEVLRRTLLDRLDLRPRFIQWPVDDQEPGDACAAFDHAVATAGGLGLIVLGLGANGHVGMNEPGTQPDAPTRVVELSASTRDAARGYGADPPPTHGVTLGMAAILAAPEVWLLATGEGKAEILHRVLEEPATADVPASWLRSHARLRVLVDDGAAVALQHEARSSARSEGRR
jgi:glucosamine-6-phosphate deaminase